MLVYIHTIREQPRWLVLGKVSHSLSSVIGTKRSLKTNSNCTHLKLSWSLARHRQRLPHYPNNLKHSNVRSCNSEPPFCFFAQHWRVPHCLLPTSCLWGKQQRGRVITQCSQRICSLEIAGCGVQPAVGAQRDTASFNNIGSDEWNMKVAQTLPI